jgi:hypothetical protein
MKRILIASTLVVAVCSLFAQPKIFPIWFEDAAGNKDTLWFGYDAAATAGLDVALGEHNIQGEPFDSTFFVFFTDAGAQTQLADPVSFPVAKSTFMMKKQWVDKTYKPLEIGIVAHNWPVKISWPNQEIQGYSDTYEPTEWSKDYSFIMTSFYPAGCWFDCFTCGWWPTSSAFTNMETTSEVETQPSYFCRYLHEALPDTVRLLYVASERISGVQDFENSTFSIRYLRSTSELNISSSSCFVPQVDVLVSDVWGRTVTLGGINPISDSELNIPFAQAMRGVYFARVLDKASRKQLANKRIIVF